jgi:membrane protease YdiL (CAAX protease family)
MQLSENTSPKSTLMAIDLLYTLGTLFSLKYLLLQFPAMWTFAGPISLIATLLVATWRLKCNNQTWRSVGLFHSTSHLKLALWAIAALIITVVLGSLAGQIIQGLIPATDVSEQVSNFTQNRFANLPGNIQVYLYWLIVSWVIGGFAEELIFRGFLISRFENLFSKLPFAIVYAIIIQAIIFGQQHFYYQGIVGFVETGIIALLSGIIYYLSKRRLWPLIISHGLANTLGMTMLFLDSTAAT